MAMAILNFTPNSSNSTLQTLLVRHISIKNSQFHPLNLLIGVPRPTSGLQILGSIRKYAIRCSAEETKAMIMRTCKNCKTQFDPSVNHPQACRYHTAHFGGETKRKFESVYTGGTMNTPDSGKVFQYWHCCGSEDPFDPGCTAAPHSSYDD